MTPPEGFVPHFRTSPLTAPWEPILSRVEADAVRIGLVLREAHCNGRMLVHGGLLAALSDNAMGLSCARVLGVLEAPGVESRPTDEAGRPRGLLTVSLGVDYVATGRPGQWLEIAPRVIRAGRGMAFADALVMVDGAIAARASATFRVG